MATGDPKKDAADRMRLESNLKGELALLRKRGIDEARVADLTELSRVAEAFAPKAPSAYERVETLIEAAIREHWGTSNLARVVQLVYGLDHTARGLGPTERYKMAYNAYGKLSETNFTTRAVRLLDVDLAKQCTAFFWSGQVAAELPSPLPPDQGDTGRRSSTPPEPATPNDDHSDERPPTAAIPAAKTSSARYSAGGKLALGLSGLIAVGVVVALVVALAGSSSGSEPLPSPGTVIDATSGEPVENASAQTADKRDEPTVGFLHFCDLSESTNCKIPVAAGVDYVEDKPFAARVGDIVEGRFGFSNSGPRPLPYFRLEVSSARFSDQVKDELQSRITWPIGHGLNAGYPSSPRRRQSQVVEAEDASLTHVVYVHGSTKLLNARGEQIGRLPDGIMDESGVYLTNLGPPENCLCDGEGYRREVSFRFKVLD